MYDSETGQYVVMEGEIIDPEPYDVETEDGFIYTVYPEDDLWDMRER